MGTDGLIFNTRYSRKHACLWTADLALASSALYNVDLVSAMICMLSWPGSGRWSLASSVYLLDHVSVGHWESPARCMSEAHTTMATEMAQL